MKFVTKLVSVAAVSAAVFATPSLAKEGNYVRKGDQVVNISVKDNRLYCTRVSDGYEMCNGMTKQANGSWTGKKMKHPDMPGFMRFKGTVTFVQGGLTIKGCAVGICQSEQWPAN